MNDAEKAALVKMPISEFNLKLFDRFPGLFSHRQDLKASLMAFGCEIGAGWRPLVWELTEKINETIEKQPLEDFYIVQIKEKFAGLRFYTSCETPKMSALIAKYERKSLKTCEECGEPGEVDDSTNWVVTLCKKHRIERKRKRDAKAERP